MLQKENFSRNSFFYHFQSNFLYEDAIWIMLLYIRMDHETALTFAFYKMDFLFRILKLSFMCAYCFRIINWIIVFEFVFMNVTKIFTHFTEHQCIPHRLQWSFRIFFKYCFVWLSVVCFCWLSALTCFFSITLTFWDYSYPFQILAVYFVLLSYPCFFCWK